MTESEPIGSVMRCLISLVFLIWVRAGSDAGMPVAAAPNLSTQTSLEPTYLEATFTGSTSELAMDRPSSAGGATPLNLQGVQS